MKQNEKILVYTVTGFLAVILGVAILFSKDSSRRLPEVQRDSAQGGSIQGPSLEDVLNRRAGDVGKGEAVDPNEPVGVPGGSPVAPVAGDQPLVANVQLAPPTPAALVTEKLGLSREEHGFRVVRAARGDTLGLLVQKWCGNLDRLEEARGLNETLETLQVGQPVVLPFVEDEVILAAFEKRTASSVPVSGVGSAPVFAPAPTPGDRTAQNGNAQNGGAVEASGASALDGVPAPAVAPANRSNAIEAVGTAGATRTHKIRKGESLWKIAEREVGKSKAPAFLESVRAINPGLDVDRLREGQVIALPTKG